MTRGTTNPNRLRRMDRWVLHAVCPGLRKAADPLAVDLGYGANGRTTQELFDRLRRHVRPDIEVVGIEIDPERVAAAQPLAEPGLSFARGGFEVPLPDGRRPFFVRAANVLRQYDESQVAGAWALVVDRLAPGGVFVEGTCDEIGRRSTWVALGAGSPVPQTFSISAHVGSLERPSDLAERLPKALIHRNVPGERIHDFLRAFDDSWSAAAPYRTFGARQRWIAAVESLSHKGFPVLDGPVRWRLGEVTVPWDVVSPS